jgi:hypothetical protein
MTDRPSPELKPMNETWLSGRPYYCAVCGLGGGEYMACEEVDCRLEPIDQAQLRLRAARDAEKPAP